MDNDKNIWIFLSHSNKDFEEVRKVRNVLEEHGFRPIMFFLKCMDDPERLKRLPQLIYNEIDYRTHFIYCKSENAENSNWVKDEIRHIQNTNRSYEVVDLNSSDTDIRKVIENYKKKFSFFISYAYKDVEFAKAIFERLSKYDIFSTWIDYNNLGASSDF